MVCIRQEEYDEVGWPKRECCLDRKQTYLKGENKGGLVTMYLLLSTSAPFTIRRRPDRPEAAKDFENGSQGVQGKAGEDLLLYLSKSSLAEKGSCACAGSLVQLP